MEDTLKLAKEKGFLPKTFSTNWTFENLLGEGKMSRGTLVNKECESNLLNEIQKWLREKHRLHVEPVVLINDNNLTWGCFVYHLHDNDFEIAQIKTILEDSYELALEAGLLSALKLIQK